MQNKLNTFLLGIIVLVLSFGVAYDSNNKKKTPTNKNVLIPTVVNKYKLADVAMHKIPTDCWTTINGSVYNVTPWISKHPGGAKAIISLCGIDGSAKFTSQHAGQARPATELINFMIGVLVQ